MNTRPILSLAVLAACGGDHGHHIDYSKCGGAVRIVVNDPDISQPPTLAIPSGPETDVSLEVQDADGNLCDPAGLDLAFDQPALVDVVDKPAPTVLKENFDFFDAGEEPMTMMSASLGGLSSSWPLYGVVDLGGDWDATVVENTIYPSGFHFGKVTFEQHGRRLAWKDCTISQVCAHAGTVQDDKLRITIPSISLDFAGQISADREQISGDWSAKSGSKSYAGNFTATRMHGK